MCTVCGGAGASFLSKSRLGFNGRLEFYQDRVACRMCFGKGQVPCLSCRGIGWILASGGPSDSPDARPPYTNPPGANPGPPVPSVSTRSFPFQDYQFVYHPADQNVWACWQHNPGNVLDVGTSTNQTRVDVASCQRGQWLSVHTEAGQPLPLAIFVGERGELLGRWL
jgi:hypothetical protein